MNQPMNPRKGAKYLRPRRNGLPRTPSGDSGKSNPRGNNQRGPQRIVDVSKSGEYKAISFRVSEEFNKKLKLACALTDMGQTELIISQIEPEVNRILKENGLYP